MKDNEDKRNKAIEIVSKDPYRIVKGNPIINAKYEISAIQAKIFLHMISKLDITQSEFQEITISVQEFAKFANIDSKDLYKIVRIESVKLMEKKISYEDEKITLDSVLLASVVYNKKQGTYTFEFPKKLSPFLLQLKDNFTGYNLQNVLILESAYSIRFFEFCKQYEKIGKFSFEVLELKEIFGITDKYKNYFDFKKKVILQAEKELRLHCELFFTFVEIKVGKKIVSLTFTIHRNKNDKNDLNREDLNKINQTQEIAELVKEFLPKEVVDKWFKHYPYEQIKASVLYSLNEYKAGKVNDISRYLQATVKLPSILQEEKTKQKEEELKRQQIIKQEELRYKIEELEKQKKELQNKYYESLNKHVKEMLIREETLYSEVLNKLNEEYQQDRRSFLVELAFDNYESIEGIEKSTIEEFMANYSKVGGAFNSYVQIYVKEKYPDFYQKLKTNFDDKAKKLNIKLN